MLIGVSQACITRSSAGLAQTAGFAIAAKEVLGLSYTSHFRPANGVSNHYAALRSFNSVSSAWHELPTRRGHFKDVPLVGDMLPNRKFFRVEWTPHGIGLMPKDLIPATALMDQGVARGRCEAEDDDDQPAAIQAITTRTWKRLKMKKHKIRKRRKADRMKN